MKFGEASAREKTLLATIAVVALALRLANAILVPGQGSNPVFSDMAAYDRAAMALVQQTPLPVHTAERYLYHPWGSDTYHPPGYYYFLACIYALFGHHYPAVRVIQAFLDTMTVLLVFGIGRLVFGKPAGLIAAAVAAIYPPLIYYSGVLLTECLSTFLLAAAIWLLLFSARTGQRPRYWALLLSGLFLGLGALVRSVLLAAVPLMLLWRLFVAERWPGWKTAARCALAVGIPIVLVIAPVTLRNYQLHHRFIPIATNGGVNFYLGHGGTQQSKDEVRGLAQLPPGSSMVGIANHTEPEEEAIFYRLGIDYILRHPKTYLRSLPAKFVEVYWTSYYWPSVRPLASYMLNLDILFWKALIFPLSLLGFLVYRGESRRRAALLYLLILSTLVVPLAFWAQPRYRVPFMPCFIPLAAGSVMQIYRRIRRRTAVETGTNTI